MYLLIEEHATNQLACLSESTPAMLMDSVERQAKFSGEDRAEFKKLRSQEYNLLLIREAMIGRTDGLLDPMVMKRITAREVAAGRMTPDDELHTTSVEAAEKLA